MLVVLSLPCHYYGKRNMNTKKSLLVILDGWGLGERPEVDAINEGKTPFFDQLMSDYPNAHLTTFGEEVGLPEGQMGNSEVGHLNIGAGRVVYQELARINKAVREKNLETTPAIQELINYAKTNDKPIHLMGLLSDGGVHAHIEHLKALCHILSDAGVKNIHIHAFMDGRDTDPRGGSRYVADLQDDIKETSAKIATVIGRYYAMDRDLRWERIKKAYDLMVKGVGTRTDDVVATLDASYASGITDEFVEPLVINEGGLIKADDAVLFFNYRTDRPRQITRALTQEDFEDHGLCKLPLHMVTMTNYDQSYQDIHVVYDKDDIEETMGQTVSAAGLSQVRIAETEKYPHVTFFFNGGREEPFPLEDRIMIPSPKVATYDLAPEMSAREVTEAICNRIKDNAPDFICLNYANADMVGHTGDFAAAQKACEVVDQCLNVLVDTALKKDYEIIVIADHGNAELMINEDGTPHTAHTTNLVPVIYVSNQNVCSITDGKLADVAPTLLALMNVKQPELMTGVSLVTFPT